MSKTPEEMAEVTTMNKQQEKFNQRFPYGRDSWKFAKPSKVFAWYTNSELILESSPTHDAVDIPAEIVEHIYKMGWEDALRAAKDVSSEECL